MKILSPTEADRKFPLLPTAKSWTVIVPAAGRGSRLGYKQAKILYPIAGRAIVDRLIDLLEPFIEHFIFVLSPEGAKQVRPTLVTRLKNRFGIAQQVEPKGMADAIYQAVPSLSSPYTLVIWGDQVAIRPETIVNVMKIQQFQPGAKLTMPVVKRPQPYVHYQLDSISLFKRVLESREGDQMPAVGQSDCGLFAFETSRLKEVFQTEIDQGIKLSRETKEWNFLPFLPKFETGGNSVNGLQLESLEETIGVNTVEDAAILEQHFQTRSDD